MRPPPFHVQSLVEISSLDVQRWRTAIAYGGCMRYKELLDQIVLLFLFGVLLCSIPALVLADSPDSDLAEQLTKPEYDYVIETRAKYAAIRADVAPLRAALAEPTHVTIDEWATLGTVAANTAAQLSRGETPPAFAAMADAHQNIYNAAGKLQEVSGGFDDALGRAGLGAAIAGGGAEELGFLTMATQLADLNGATEQLEDALAAAEAGLETLVASRVEELAEQVEMLSGISEILGISLDPDDYCFIATAAYNTPAAEEIDVLRDFRDEVLLQYGPGRAFVDYYYEYSPPVASFVAEREWLRTAVREGFVAPIVWVLQETQVLWASTETP